jgi:thymidylate kinase
MKQSSLIVIGGFAGAGKTTIANKLSGQYNYPIYSSDVINDALRAAFQKEFHEVSPTAYEVLWHLVRQQLKNGVTLIVDTHMASPKVWEKLDLLHADMPGVQILPIILQCTLETHRERIEKRGRTNTEHLNLGGDKFEDVLFKYDFIEQLHRPDLIRVDANKTSEEVYDSVERILKEHKVLR